MASRQYVGKAGHLAIMAEFLLRGYNVAMPEVDIGDDIFVVSDDAGRLWRVQVKTGIAKVKGNGYEVKVAASLRQLKHKRTPDLFYVLALRLGERWEFLILPRVQLRDEHLVHNAGSPSEDRVLFTLRVDGAGVFCSGRDWQAWRNAWGEWPVIP